MFKFLTITGNMMPPQQSMSNMPPHSQHQPGGYRMPMHQQQRGYMQQQQQPMMGGPQNGNQGNQMMGGQQPMGGYRQNLPQGKPTGPPMGKPVQQGIYTHYCFTFKIN